jgi:hypothetical protein
MRKGKQGVARRSPGEVNLFEASEVFEGGGEERGKILCGMFGVPLCNSSALRLGSGTDSEWTLTIFSPKPRTLPWWVSPRIWHYGLSSTNER